MANEKFEFIFQDETNKRYSIDEPINFSEVDFDLNRREKGLGFDSTLSGGEVNFRFTIYRRHYLEKLLELYNLHFYEADVKLIITLENGDVFTGELDFYSAVTDDLKYLECPVILESEMQVFRRREKTKVDLFSDRDINGEVIEPLVPINMLLKAKPSIQTSTWQVATPFTTTASAASVAYVNLTQSLIDSEIADSYVPYSNNSRGDRSGTQILLAQSNLKNVVLNISLDSVFISDEADINATIAYIKTTGNVDDSTPYTTIFNKNTSSGSFTIIDDFTVNLGDFQRGEKLYLFLRVSTTGIGNPVRVNKSDVSLVAESTAYNSITPTFRLIDVMKQIAKSYAGLEVYAPRYDFGGEFYDTVLTSGKLLGGNITDPFYVSWEDIENSFGAENNADSEISVHNNVFVGIEDDYFTNEECGFFDSTQFREMSKKSNPEFAINEFKFKYDNFQSLKENTEPNSGSTIHGESILTLYNQKVENEKALTIKWIRDAILLDVQQRLSTKVSKDTATQDDDKIFAIDTIATENDQQFTESTTLQHTYSDTYLSLRSNGDVNFVVLGIREGTNFIIEYPDSNTGIYTVLSAFTTELQLVKTSGGAISSANDGIRLTRYTYEIKQETIPLTNRTNEGFTSVANLISPERYSNLRYSVERNIRRFWNRFLATCNLAHKNKPVINTYYRNNGLCETEYNGLRVIEKEDFIPDNPIMTPFMYDKMVFVNVDFSDYIALQNSLRTKHGFIRCIDNNNRVLKVYPITMSYSVSKRGRLTISGNEKFEPAFMTIVKESGLITINNETRLRNLGYSVVEGNKIALFDLQRQRLYNPVAWDKVSVNGVNAETLEILKSWLDLL